VSEVRKNAAADRKGALANHFNF